MGLLVAVPATLAPPLSHRAFAASYSTTVLADAPDAYWRLGETSGTTAADATGHGYNATISGGVTLGTSGALLGDPATAMSFDGQTGAIDTPYLQNAVTAYSVEMWINTTDTGAKQLEQVRSQGGNTSGMSLTMWLGATGGGHGGPGTLSFELDSNAIEIGQTTVGTVNDGSWHHVVGTWAAASGTAVSASQFLIYIDGFLAPSTSSVNTQWCSCTPQSPLSGLGGVHLARSESSGGLPYQGRMEEAAIYTHVLSGQRVAAHFTASGRTMRGAVPASSTYGQTVLADGPAAYFRLGDPAGSATIVDSSPNTNSGLVTGAVTLGVAGALPNESTATAASFGGGTIATSYVQRSVTAYTEEVWLKTTSTVNRVLLFNDRGSSGGGHSVSMYLGQSGGTGGGPGQITFEMDTNNQDVGVTGTRLVNDGVWHHLVGTWTAPPGTAVDPSQFQLYIDGVAAATTPDNHNYCGCPAITSPLSGSDGVGISPGGINSPLTGTLEEAAIYTKALTPAQIATHYQASGGAVPPNGPPITATEVSAGENFCWICYAKRTVHGSRADPVSTATGAFFENYTDLSIPGRGLPIAFVRTYSSARASTTSVLGYGWTHGYAMSLSTDASGNATITGPDGSQTVFTLSGTTYSGPPRAQATLVKNADGTYTFTQAARTTYIFNAQGQLVQENDLNGYVTALAYNGSGQLSTITDPAGRPVTFAYTGSTLTRLTDPTGRIVSFVYDGSGNLSRVTDVNGGVSAFAYDPNHLLLTITDPRGNVVTTNHYDASQRVDRQTDALNRTTTFAYTGTPLSSAGGSTTTTDPKGNVTVDQYISGERTAITRGYGTPQAATWQYRYDPSTLGPTLVVDPNGHATSSTYDANGNRTSATDPLRRTTTYTYDSLNDLTSGTDPLGATTTLSYDSKGNLLSRSTPLVGASPAQNQVTTYTYGDATHPGDVTAVTDPDGKVSHTSYDANGDVASTTDPLGDQATMTYNVVGWPLTTVSPRGNVTGGTPSQFTTTYSYADPTTGATDQFGDVRVITDPQGDKTTKSYDADRNLVSVQDPDGNLTRYSFDVANQQTDVTRADGTKLHTDYYPDGSVQDQVNGAGNKTGYMYDSLGHVASMTDPLGNVTALSNDALGNVLSKTDPGGSCAATPKVGCTTNAYDAANQLASITYSDGTTPNVTGLSYDADGQRTAMTDGTGSSAWSWDSLHRMTSYTNGAGTAVSFAYNLRGLETGITYPGSHTVTQGFDDAGRLTSVQDWLGNTTSFGYDANSDLTSETFPTTGVVDTLTFDRADRMMSVSDASGVSTPFSAVYTRDANGQVTSDTSATSARGTYRYTALDQVCYAGTSGASGCASAPLASQPFAYDAADNLTQIGSTQQTFNAAGELCWTGPAAGTCASPPAGATAYSYDLRGNRTSVTLPGLIGPTTTTIAYDQANRLTAYGSVATYSYNGDGLRMSKSARGATTQYVWNVSGSLPLLLQDGSTGYVYGPGGLPLEQITGSTVLYYHHDGLGSTRLLTSASGAPVATYTFDPYGNLPSSTGNAINPFLYAGQYSDAESGFYYLRARYYDPSTAQFLTRDPMVAKARSPYGYVNDNPLNATDPSGLCADPNIPCTSAPSGWQPSCMSDRPCINAQPRYTDSVIIENGVELTHLGGNDCLGEQSPYYRVVGPTPGYHWDLYTVPGARAGDVVRETAPWSGSFVDKSGNSVWISADPSNVNNSIDPDLHLNRGTTNGLWETLLQGLSFF